jgi:hypothetical protein
MKKIYILGFALLLGLISTLYYLQASFVKTVTNDETFQLQCVYYGVSLESSLEKEPGFQAFQEAVTAIDEINYKNHWSSQTEAILKKACDETKIEPLIHALPPDKSFIEPNASQLASRFFDLRKTLQSHPESAETILRFTVLYASLAFHFRSGFTSKMVSLSSLRNVLVLLEQIHSEHPEISFKKGLKELWVFFENLEPLRTMVSNEKRRGIGLLKILKKKYPFQWAVYCLMHGDLIHNYETILDDPKTLTISPGDFPEILGLVTPILSSAKYHYEKSIRIADMLFLGFKMQPVLDNNYQPQNSRGYCYQPDNGREYCLPPKVY